jgi:hypothetical protein
MFFYGRTHEHLHHGASLTGKGQERVSVIKYGWEQCYIGSGIVLCTFVRSMYRHMHIFHAFKLQMGQEGAGTSASAYQQAGVEETGGARRGW